MVICLFYSVLLYSYYKITMSPTREYNLGASSTSMVLSTVALLSDAIIYTLLSYQQPLDSPRVTPNKVVNQTNTLPRPFGLPNDNDFIG